jgi:nucleotide-binding universal stress UspA family protein
MKCVLVATDGSKSANRAVDYAAELAKVYGANLLIVNIIGGYDLPEKLFRTFTRAQQVWLEQEFESLSAEILKIARERARALGVTVQLESRAGDAAQTIIELAQEKGVILIVVGKRGTGRIAGLLLGSVSQKLISLAPMPVTVVP